MRDTRGREGGERRANVSTVVLLVVAPLHSLGSL